MFNFGHLSSWKHHSCLPLHLLWCLFLDIFKSEREKARDKLIKTYKVTEFFKVNQDVGTLEGKGKEKYLECVKKLLNYAIVLLKQRNMRPGNWEVSFLLFIVLGSLDC